MKSPGPKTLLKQFEKRMRSDICPICKRDWKECPHSYKDIDREHFRLKVRAAL
jgi:hypothetical protein